MEHTVLSYHDSLLTSSDVNLLEPSKWLNDKLIGFCFEFFERKTFKTEGDRLCFINPDVTQFVKLAAETLHWSLDDFLMENNLDNALFLNVGELIVGKNINGKHNKDEDIGAFLQPLELPKKEVICSAVNDSVITDEVSGSHWSLLVYRRDTEELQHYDSCNQSNSDVAKKLARKITKYLSAGKDVTFKEMKSPTQQNSCDCGVYVVCNAEHLCKLYLKRTDLTLQETVTPQYVTEKRKQIKELIYTLSGKT